MNSLLSKPRRNDLLANLLEEQRAILNQWLLDRVSFKQVAENLAKLPPDGFGVRVSDECVRRYYHRFILAEDLAQTFAIADTLPCPRASLKNLLQQSALTTALQTELPPATFQILARYYRTLSAEHLQQRLAQQRDLQLQLNRDRHNLETFKAQYIAAREALNNYAELAAIYNDQTLDDPAKIERARQNLFGAAAIPAPAPSNLLPQKI